MPNRCFEVILLLADFAGLRILFDKKSPSINSKPLLVRIILLFKSDTDSIPASNISFKH